MPITHALAPKLQGLRVRAVRVPMQHPHQTASGVVSESPLVLTDAITDDGVVGHSVVFTYTPAALKPTAELIRNFEALVKGQALAPIEIEQRLSKRFRLLGTQGLVGIALSAIDMALWDALARSHGTSLVRLLGGVEKAFPAYGAVGGRFIWFRQMEEVLSGLQQVSAIMQIQVGLQMATQWYSEMLLDSNPATPPPFICST